MLMFGINAFVDAIFIGQALGEIALAGVSLVFPLTSFIFGLSSLVGVGVSSYLSILLGQNKYRLAGLMPAFVFTLSLILAVLPTTAGLFFDREIIGLMGGSGEIQDIGSEYFRLRMYFSFFVILGVSSNMLIRAEGKMATAMWLASIGIISNMIFNYVFIILLDMGVAGAAHATNIGMIAYSLANLTYYLRSKSSYPIWKGRLFYLNKDILRRIVPVGAPALVQSSMQLLQQGLIFNLLEKYGDETDIAFYGVVGRLFLVSLIPVFGMVRSVQPVFGINYGAGRFDRVRKANTTFTSGGLMLMGSIATLMLIFPEAAVKALVPDLYLGEDRVALFRMVMSIVPFLPFIFMTIVLNQSISNGKIAIGLTVLRQVLVFIPLLFLFTYNYGVSGVYYTMFTSEMLIVILSILASRYQLKHIK
ncbi:MAG: MATE family efflux transporter [Candidatus Kapaibacteriales bacterium]